MSQHYPALIVIVPLLTALVVFAIGWVDRRWCYPLSVASLVVSLLSSFGLLQGVLEAGSVSYRLGGWPPPVGIYYHVDYLNILVLMVVSAVALVNLIGVKKTAEIEFQEKTSAFYSLYLMFVAGLSGMVVTGDAFNLYVLLEIAALTGYALIGLGHERAPLSALNYVIMGTIGASFYLLGVGYLYLATGTLNMLDMARILPTLSGSTIVMVAFAMCLMGALMKMAFFPLHGWLPNAYSFAPSSSAGVIAPLTTKVMVYVMVRVVLTIFQPEYSFESMQISDALVWLSVIAIVCGSLMALYQKSLKKILTYIVVAEVGYMVGGFWLGNRTGMSGAILHIVNDAVMTLCVFLGAAAFAYRLEDDRLENFQGIFKKMPFTMIGFVTGGMAIIGIPPTCGFFSKWFLISGGLEAGHYGFVAALLFSSLVNAVIFFKIFEICYFEPFGGGHGHDTHGSGASVISEAPISLVFALLLTAVMLIGLGVFSGDIVTQIIQFAIPAQIV